MIIVLEGLEGVGKTTLGELLSQAMSAKYLKSPPKEYNSIRGYLAANSDKYANFYFYLSSLFLLQKELKEFKAGRHHVIVDRYIHSTIAYHDAGNIVVPPSYDNALLKADLTIHITCSEKVRQNRRQLRGFHLYDRAECNEANIFEYFRRNSDCEFCNDNDLSMSVCTLVDQITGRLSKDIDTFR